MLCVFLIAKHYNIKNSTALHTAASQREIMLWHAVGILFGQENKIQ